MQARGTAPGGGGFCHQPGRRRELSATADHGGPAGAQRRNLSGDRGRLPHDLGLLLALSGWAIWLGSLSPLLVLPLFWLVITYAQIIPEEQALGKIFGEKYAVYCRQVNRWMGRRPQRP